MLRIHDKRGYPIYAGDLLKTYNFTGARKRKYYMYHLVVAYDGGDRMINASALLTYREQKLPGCLVSTVAVDGVLHDSEIVEGFGPLREYVDFEDRPRMRVPARGV